MGETASGRPNTGLRRREGRTGEKGSGWGGKTEPGCLLGGEQGCHSLDLGLLITFKKSLLPLVMIRKRFCCVHAHVALCWAF